ncbi:MAG: TonB family protein [Beijerinckiaceae bacterium]|jgi:protein TonB
MTGAPPLDDPILIARADDRLFAWDPRALRNHKLFVPILLLVLLVHVAALVYFLYRDSKATMQTSQLEETPIEVVVEPPPDQLKPPPPKPPEKKPEPPKPKEEIEKPAYSAPRAPNEQTVDTKQTQQKTEAPKAATPPRDGRPEPAKEASTPKDQASPDKPQEATAKPEEDKPDAEALDKATQPKKKTDAKDSKTPPKPKKPATTDAVRQLAGLSNLQNFSFAAPTPKAPVYGGTEDVRYLAIVQGLIMQKVKNLPRLDRYQEGGEVAVYFHIDDTGRIISMEIMKKSGIPAIDAMAMDAVRQAAPFPPPPRAVPHGLIWGTSVEGQLPMRVMR